ncbi:MAG: redoxin domain-containing protein, partial [Gemmatimonadota bacterium]|nr:redoxin domain-containing protein [Gemmatimonadota bacterium]
QLLGVLYQDTPENGREFIRKYGGGWPTVVDPGSATAIPYGVYGPPETFVVSPDGTIAYKLLGALTPNTWPAVTGTIDSLLAARGPRG